MKRTSAILFIACVHMQAYTCAQVISLHLHNSSLKEAFAEIKRQTSINVLYTEEIISIAKPLSCSLTNVTLETALITCFLDQPLTYEMVNSTVVVKMKEATAYRVDPLVTITGTVSYSAIPLSHVSVMVKGTARGTFTGIDGQFTLAQVPARCTLLISCVGYRTVEWPTEGQSIADVSLLPSVIDLDETVIIGYGTTTKRYSTGGRSTIRTNDISTQPVSNALQALQGRVSGLNIIQQTGMPGGNFSIQLRGQNSIRPEGNRLLFVIDGVPVNTGTLQVTVQNGPVSDNPLNGINPNDIDNIQILKDADATAIYGSRGANGVVLVTTRKAQKGDALLNVRFSGGCEKVMHRLEVLDTKSYLSMRREAFLNDGKQPQRGVDDDLLQWDPNKNTDWQSTLIGGTAAFLQSGISISAGTGQTRLYISGNHLKETTVFPGEFYDRKKSLLANISHKSINERLISAMTLYFLQQDNQLFRTDITAYAVTLPPNTPNLVHTDHTLQWPSGIGKNPYASLSQPRELIFSNLLVSNTIQYEMNKSFRLLVNLGLTNMASREATKIPFETLKPSARNTDGLTSIFNGRINMRTWIAEPQIKWEKSISWHRIIWLVGTTFQETVTEFSTKGGVGFVPDIIPLNPQPASAMMTLAGWQSRYRYSSGFSRMSYAAMDKFLLNITARADASSRFGPDNKIAGFGAIGAGWLFYKEKVLRSDKCVISYGKLRGSYGLTGNDQISDYGFMERWSPTDINYLGPGLRPDNLRNSAYGWETNRKLEMAMEIGLFRDNFVATLAWYRNRSTNQLIGYSLPGITGFTAVLDNVPAIVQNKGFEVELAARLKQSKTFSWKIECNISIPDNKLISFPRMDATPYAHMYEVGQSLNISRKYHNTGVDPQTGMYTFYDYDKDGRISYPNDVQSSGVIGLKYFGGVANALRYRHFEFGFFFQFVKQTGINYLSGFSAPGTLGNQLHLTVDHWRSPGDGKLVQRMTQDPESNAYETYIVSTTSSDRTFSDASFIRLKNLYLSWTAASGKLKKFRMSACSVFLKAQNVLTLTTYEGMDPENQDINRLPPLGAVVAGFEIRL